MISVRECWLYPVKSLRGFRVESATLTSQGLQWDRHWMLIDATGQFLSQRKIPAMAMIRTKLSTNHLILSKKGMNDCLVPLAYPKANATRTASIWKDNCDVILEEESINQWLKSALGCQQAVFLVRMKQEAQRSQSKADLLGEQTHTLFADAAPFLITNTASLASINQTLISKDFEPVTIEQFRPNIVIDGLAAFEEHTIKHLSHPDYQFQHCYPCQRCIMTTINPDTAEVHPQQEPFISLMGINTMPNNKKAPAFGENAILICGENHNITVGDHLIAQND